MDNSFINEAVDELHTIQDLLRWSVSLFNANEIYYGHGTDNPWDEALALVLPTLYLPLNLPEEMYRSRLTPSERLKVIERVVRRITDRVPVAYLTNKAWFCGLEFYVNEQVLIPRSPIGEWIQKEFAGLIAHSPKHILDLCTGSGCIAIACAFAFPQAEVDASDISAEVLTIAEHNIHSYGLENRVIPLRSDLFCELAPVRYDLIITNPPYVDAEDMADLPPEYLHEPISALAAGSDGLMLVRRILANAADYLSEQGVLICEVGNSQLQLNQLYPQIPFHWLEITKGGDGIFALTRQQLLACQVLLSEYQDGTNS